MSPQEEARCIELWQAGTETTAMAQALGLPVGTVSSRAHALRQQGKIAAWPQGGNYPRQQAFARWRGISPPASPAVPAPPATERKDIQ